MKNGKLQTKHWLANFFRLYLDGFKEMTWGRVLWALIFIKLFVMFAVLRLFFFQPYLQGDEDAKQQAVCRELIERASP
jgi:hypothetical protein